MSLPKHLPFQRTPSCLCPKYNSFFWEKSTCVQCWATSGVSKCAQHLSKSSPKQVFLACLEIHSKTKEPNFCPYFIYSMLALKATLNPSTKQFLSLLHSLFQIVQAPQRPRHETSVLGAVQTWDTMAIPAKRDILYTPPRRIKTEIIISKLVIIDSGPQQSHTAELKWKVSWVGAGFHGVLQGASKLYGTSKDLSFLT